MIMGIGDWGLGIALRAAAEKALRVWTHPTDVRLRRVQTWLSHAPHVAQYLRYTTLAAARS